MRSPSRTTGAARPAALRSGLRSAHVRGSASASTYITAISAASTGNNQIGDSVPVDHDHRHEGRHPEVEREPQQQERVDNVDWRSASTSTSASAPGWPARREPLRPLTTDAGERGLAGGDGGRQQDHHDDRDDTDDEPRCRSSVVGARAAGLLALCMFAVSLGVGMVPAEHVEHTVHDEEGQLVVDVAPVPAVAAMVGRPGGQRRRGTRRCRRSAIRSATAWSPPSSGNDSTSVGAVVTHVLGVEGAHLGLGDEA